MVLLELLLGHTECFIPKKVVTSFCVEQKDLHSESLLIFGLAAV